MSVAGLVRRFGDHTVLDGVDLDVVSGSVAMVLGDNGSGKSTLLRILAGVLDADAGRVSVAGAPPRHGLSSFVPAGDRMLHWRLTGAQNLGFFARLAGAAGPRLEADVRFAAAALDAEDLLQRKVGECSMGQRRRLMLAVGFLARAPVVLLDEPDADLDEDGRDAVEAACRSWADHGGVVVFASPTADNGLRADALSRLTAGRIEMKA
ncbi:MAG: ABC transporter ATP-binding protein [Actinobacteria bacterium]|nr:ABC transporter ATP-binding protein [Actinomycetota bacterium]